MPANVHKDLRFRRSRLPKLWLGADACTWWRLLIRNRFAVELRYLPLGVFICVMTLRNTILQGLHELIWGRRIQATEIHHAPIFVIGHWRTGTTMLHELLSLDQRHTYPTTYACVFPHHFLLTERFFSHLFRFNLPSRRPMDNMAMAWDLPNEDELALCNLGQPSPYLSWAFPNRPAQDLAYLTLDGISPEALQRWQHCLLRFFKQLTVRTPKRLVLKSPTHTCRINVLLDLFPEARFVYIIRNPYVVIPSTINLWKTLYENFGLQRPTFNGLEDAVIDTYLRMDEKLEATRHLADTSRFYELRYEDLVRDPIGEMRAVYEHLKLGGFEDVVPKLQHYVAEKAQYQPNRYTVSPELRALITRRLGSVIQRYGYAYEPDGTH